MDAGEQVEALDLEFSILHFRFGTWDLVFLFGIWCLEFGILTRYL